MSAEPAACGYPLRNVGETGTCADEAVTLSGSCLLHHGLPRGYVDDIARAELVEVIERRSCAQESLVDALASFQDRLDQPRRDHQQGLLDALIHGHPVDPSAITTATWSAAARRTDRWPPHVVEAAYNSLMAAGHDEFYARQDLIWNQRPTHDPLWLRLLDDPATVGAAIQFRPLPYDEALLRRLLDDEAAACWDVFHNPMLPETAALLLDIVRNEKPHLRQGLIVMASHEHAHNDVVREAVGTDTSAHDSESLRSLAKRRTPLPEDVAVLLEADHRIVVRDAIAAHRKRVAKAKAV